MHAKRSVALLLLLLVCASCSRKEARCSHAVESELTPLEPAPDAAPLLRQVEARYARLTSYADSGCVFRTFGGTFRHSDRRPFETTFARPSTFRFEYTQASMGLMSQRYVIWTEPGVVRSWWTVTPKIEHHPSIAFAAGVAGGVSGGASSRVLTLLLGTAGSGWPITQLRHARVLGTQQLPGGTVCRVVAGENRQGDRVRLWVEPATLAIHRVHVVYALRDGPQVDTTTVYHPRFDAKVDATRIKFDPPRQIRLGGFKIDVRRKSDRRLVCHCR
jgi:outer membrane lipoprotein-sorting protein